MARNPKMINGDFNKRELSKMSDFTKQAKAEFACPHFDGNGKTCRCAGHAPTSKKHTETLANNISKWIENGHGGIDLPALSNKVAKHFKILEETDLVWQVGTKSQKAMYLARKSLATTQQTWLKAIQIQGGAWWKEDTNTYIVTTYKKICASHHEVFMRTLDLAVDSDSRSSLNPDWVDKSLGASLKEQVENNANKKKKLHRVLKKLDSSCAKLSDEHEFLIKWARDVVGAELVGTTYEIVSKDVLDFLEECKVKARAHAAKLSRQLDCQFVHLENQQRADNAFWKGLSSHKLTTPAPRKRLFELQPENDSTAQGVTANDASSDSSSDSGNSSDNVCASSNSSVVVDSTSTLADIIGEFVTTMDDIKSAIDDVIDGNEAV